MDPIGGEEMAIVAEEHILVVEMALVGAGAASSVPTATEWDTWWIHAIKSMAIHLVIFRKIQMQTIA